MALSARFKPLNTPPLPRLRLRVALEPGAPVDGGVACSDSLPGEAALLDATGDDVILPGIFFAPCFQRRKGSPIDLTGLAGNPDRRGNVQQRVATTHCFDETMRSALLNRFLLSGLRFALPNGFHNKTLPAFRVNVHVILVNSSAVKDESGESAATRAKGAASEENTRRAPSTDEPAAGPRPNDFPCRSGSAFVSFHEPANFRSANWLQASTTDHRRPVERATPSAHSPLHQLFRFRRQGGPSALLRLIPGRSSPGGRRAANRMDIDTQRARRRCAYLIAYVKRLFMSKISNDIGNTGIQAEIQQLESDLKHGGKLGNNDIEKLLEMIFAIIEQKLGGSSQGGGAFGNGGGGGSTQAPGSTQGPDSTQEPSTDNTTDPSGNSNDLQSQIVSLLQQILNTLQQSSQSGQGLDKQTGQLIDDLLKLLQQLEGAQGGNQAGGGQASQIQALLSDIIQLLQQLRGSQTDGSNDTGNDPSNNPGNTDGTDGSKSTNGSNNANGSTDPNTLTNDVLKLLSQLLTMFNKPSSEHTTKA
ncbi:hypothetical protein [Burkholderia sp. 22313]|uniref:hypothetical protein n=1 Tax=Burkholderia sp. 22313 TaxID=3453908 RepID=UPI003F879AB7